MTMVEKARKAITASIPDTVQLLITIAVILFTAGGAFAYIKIQSENNRDQIANIDVDHNTDIVNLKNEIINEIARIELEQKGSWTENEREHDRMVEFQYETRNIISSFAAVADAIKSDVTELKYEWRDAGKQLELNRAEMQAWQRDRIDILKSERE